MVLSKDMKIAICFGLIMGVILSVCNMCFASEQEQVVVSQLMYTSFSQSNPTITESASSGGVGYFVVEPGYRYIITNNSTGADKFFGYSNEEPALGVVVNGVTKLSKGSTFVFDGSAYGYLYFDYYSYASVVSVTREKLDGLPSFVDNIAYALSFVNLNGIVANAVPILAIGVLLGLGFYLLKRLLNKIKRAKGGA